MHGLMLTSPLLLTQTLSGAQGSVLGSGDCGMRNGEAAPWSVAALPRAKSLDLCSQEKSELRSRWGGYFSGAKSGGLWREDRRTSLNALGWGVAQEL